MSTRRSLLLFALTAAAAALLGAVPSALAESGATASAEIMIMHATQVPGAGSIDPKIGSMPQLQKPPFSAYNTYTLVDKRSLRLAQNAPATYEMVNGRTLQLTLLDVTGDKRFHVNAAINKPKQDGGAAFLKLLEVTAAPNEPFFVGGQIYKGGTLVIGVTLSP